MRRLIRHRPCQRTAWSIPAAGNRRPWYSDFFGIRKAYDIGNVTMPSVDPQERVTRVRVQTQAVASATRS